jgi:hypothetical protein
MRDQMIIDLITAGRLRVAANTGFVYAPKSNSPNKACGSITKKGYLRICMNINGRQCHFMAHRVVWVSVNGLVPDKYEIDHKNAIKTDNRIENLEAVTGAENMHRGAMNGCFSNVGRKDGIRDAKGRFGKKRAGRLLDGVTHEEYPDVAHGL